MSKNRIREIRKAKGLNQRQLAELIGSHFVTISKLERGEMQLTLSWIDRIAKGLNVSLEDILEEKIERRLLHVIGDIRRDGSASTSEQPEVLHTHNFQDFEDPVAFWMVVEDGALYPLVGHGCRVKFIDVLDSFDDYVGHFCYVRDRVAGEIAGFVSIDPMSGGLAVRPMNGQPVYNLKEIERFGCAVEIRFPLPPPRQSDD